jgi:hypothetical protein
MAYSETNPYRIEKPMPRKAVYAEDLRAEDLIEFGSTEFFITDVVIDNSVGGVVQLTMYPTGYQSDEHFKAHVIVFKHWPFKVYRR